MRRRSTFIPDASVDFDPSQIKLGGQKLSFSGLVGAREERYTTGLGELPVNLTETLKSLHELHVRWVSDEQYLVSSPYLSSLNPGLHVYFTPSTVERSQSTNPCDFIKAYFFSEARCSTAEQSFSQPGRLQDDLSSQPAFQYYTVLDSLQQFVSHPDINQLFSSSSALGSTSLLESASYLDLDYDSVNHALIVTVFWAQAPSSPQGSGKTSWSVNIDGKRSDKNEVGILQQAASSPGSEELHVEGVLAVVGEDSAPKPTMFFIPSRHRRLEGTQAKGQEFTVSFNQPTGLHPTMRLTFPSQLALGAPADKPESSTCALHAYMTLPSVLFLDEYAFPQGDLDPLFTDAHHIRMLRSLSGERDLEAPDYSVVKWGSAVLLELETPMSPLKNTTWDVTIPLHLRYLDPSSGGIQSTQVPWPVVFWACTAEEGTKFAVNPFDRTTLGYDHLFGPRTMFYHLNAVPGPNAQLTENIQIPVVNTDSMSVSRVETATLVLVLAGFAYIAIQIIRALTRTGDTKRKTKAQ